MKTSSKIRYTFGLVTILSVFSCNTFLENVDTPSNIIVPEQVYNDARTVTAAVNGLYTQNLLSNQIYYYALPFYLTVITDDAYHTSTSYDDLRTNNYSPTNTYLAYFWTYPYESVFLSNDLINSFPAVTVITDDEKQQYIGEAKYFRAYSYFILTALFGDVPLVLSTKILETTLQPREAKETVVQLIIQDLKDAEVALANSGNSNTKVTKAAASALLARTYLYHEEWQNAENKADEVIRTSGYSLDAIENVFLRTSTETIFRTSSSGSWSSYIDRLYFAQLAGNSNYLRLYPDLINSFEAGDLRRENWTIAKTASGTQYYHSYKYKRTAATSPGSAEDFVSLRLAEQYLIRAEARAQQNKLTDESGAIADLNIIRARAGLSALPQSLTKEEVLLQVEQERRHEFFAEEAHRWWDLVRTNRADAVLGVFEGKQWKSHKALLPVPEAEINKNKKLTQNPGYGVITD